MQNIKTGTLIECKENPWQWGWDSVGVISSGILSFLLIGFTIWIAIRQNRIQKQISDRDIKAQNYQHRSRCYLQMINSFQDLAKTHGFTMGHLYNGTPIPIVTVNDLDKGRWGMFSVKKEAKMLFSADLSRQISEIYELYAEYSQQFTMFYFSQTKLSDKLREIDFEKYMNAHRDSETMQEIENISKELASLIKIHCLAQDKFKSEEFNDLFINETKTE